MQLLEQPLTDHEKRLQAAVVYLLVREPVVYSSETLYYALWQSVRDHPTGAGYRARGKEFCRKRGIDKKHMDIMRVAYYEALI